MRLFERAQLARRGSSPKSYIDACVCNAKMLMEKTAAPSDIIARNEGNFLRGKIKNIEFENGILVTIERFQA